MLELLALGGNGVDFDLGGFLAGQIGVERSLLHHDELLLEVFFELSEVVFGLVGLSLDLDGNVLFDRDGHVLEVVPVFLGGKSLLEVVVFVDSFFLVFSETLFDHVESQEIFFLLGLDDHETFFDLS